MHAFSYDLYFSPIMDDQKVETSVSSLSWGRKMPLKPIIWPVVRDPREQMMVHRIFKNIVFRN